MDSPRWEQIVDLYERANEHDPATRDAFLTEVCNGDDELHQEVLSLLGQDGAQLDLLESLAFWSSSARLPASIGAYRILGLIGEGGMGTVYEAEQENPRRIVALKIVKPGLAAPEILRRFKQESQALARLQHTGIAQIHEAGIAKGRPYFAMERIRGRPLRDYTTAQRLTTTQKLELMIKICDAVQHAHERGIIHRDLKPGNILVDEIGQPKILDFGVARITDADSQLTRGTDLGKLVGTLAYMSPEQVTGDPAELDARSDVYALGLILYELLAGRAPYETGRNPTEAVRVIQEQDPLPLRTVSRGFRGDLDTIAAKALEKDKSRRYGSAADLAADLRRHLADQPILGRPAGSIYLTQKFVRRHRALTGALSSIFVVLVAGILVSTWQASRARRAVQIATAVNDFLQNDLLGQASPRAQASPNTRPDPDLKVRMTLDRAAARIAGKFASQPEVEAAVRHTVGNAYMELSLYADARPHLERALDLRRRILGNQQRDTQETMQALASLYFRSGNNTRAEALTEELLGIRRRLLGNRHPDTLGTMNDLATVIGGKGDWARAAKLLKEVFETERISLGEQDPATLTAMHNLSIYYINLGQFGAAAELLQKVVEIKQRVLGAEHPSTMLSMNNLAVAYRNLGKYADAEALLNRVLEARRRSMGEEHQDTLASMNSLALLYQAEGRYDDAERLLSQSLASARRVLPNHADTTRFMANLAEVYWKQGKLQPAERLFREAIDGRRRTLGPKHPTTAAALVSLGEMKLDQKQFAEAEPILRDAAGIYEKSAPGDWRRYYAQAMLGEALAGLGRRAEAGPLLTSAYQSLLQKKESIPSEKRKILETVGNWKSQLP